MKLVVSAEEFNPGEAFAPHVIGTAPITDLPPGVRGVWIRMVGRWYSDPPGTEEQLYISLGDQEASGLMAQLRDALRRAGLADDEIDGFVDEAVQRLAPLYE